MSDKKENKNYQSIGTENYKVPDCPFHLPKQNAQFFQMMKKSISDNYGKYGVYPNLQK